MAIKFDKEYVNVARKEFCKVYVDRITPESVIGSSRAYIGDRIRIYMTGWYYENPIIFKTNEGFKKWLREYLNTSYEGIEFAKPVLA